MEDGFPIGEGANKWNSATPLNTMNSAHCIHWAVQIRITYLNKSHRTYMQQNIYFSWKIDKIQFLWASNSEFSICFKNLHSAIFRVIFGGSVSIELGSKYAPESQSLLIRRHLWWLSIRYWAILYTELQNCSMYALCNAVVHGDLYRASQKKVIFVSLKLYFSLILLKIYTVLYTESSSVAQYP